MRILMFDHTLRPNWPMRVFEAAATQLETMLYGFHP